MWGISFQESSLRLKSRWVIPSLTQAALVQRQSPVLRKLSQWSLQVCILLRQTSMRSFVLRLRSSSSMTHRSCLSQSLRLLLDSVSVVVSSDFSTLRSSRSVFSESSIWTSSPQCLTYHTRYIRLRASAWMFTTLQVFRLLPLLTVSKNHISELRLSRVLIIMDQS